MSRSLIRWKTLSPWLAALLCAVSAGAQTFYWNRNAALTNDKAFGNAYNWTANADGTGAHPTSGTDDDFTADALGSAWTFYDNDNDAGTGSNSLTTNADQITLSGRGTNIWGATNQFVAVHRGDYIGNFDVSVKITGGDAAGFGLIVADTVSSLGNGGFAVVKFAPGTGVKFEADAAAAAGTLDYSATDAVVATAAPLYIRLVKNGLTFSGYVKKNLADAWTQVGTTQTPMSGSLFSQVGLFSCAGSATVTKTGVFDDWQGGTAITGTGYALSLNGTGANADADAVLSADVSAASLDFTGYTGTLSFGGQNGLFATYYDNVDFTGTSLARVDSTVNFNWASGSPGGTLAATTWSAKWEGYVQPLYTETYTFYSSSDDGQRLWVNGQLLIDNWVDQVNTEKSATIALTAGVKYPIVYTYYQNGGGDEAYLRWSSTTQVKEIIPKRYLFGGKLTVTGTGTAVNMASGTVTAADGLIDFAAASGIQTLVPRSLQTMPRIHHSGAGTLQLSTNALTTLGFSQSAGILDFNGLNITTAASGSNLGDFAVWNGTTTSFSNLGGRTLTVVGHASFAGQSGNLLNLNPASAWTLTVTGQQTADYASIGNCNANGTSGFKQAFYSTDAGANAGWIFNGTTFYWNRDSLIVNTNANTTYNWTSNAAATGFRPLTTASDKFASTTLGSGWTLYSGNGSNGNGGLTLSGGQLSMTASGGDMYGGTNQFYSVYRTDITGDYFDVTVKMMGQTNTSVWAKAGILMANNVKDLTQGGYAYAAVTPGNGWDFQWDNAAPVGQIESGTNVGSVTFPCWLRLVRNGTSVSAYYKTTLGGTWTLIDAVARTPVSLANGTNSQIALFVSSNNSGTSGTVIFDDFESGTNLSDADADLSFNGTGTNADANATLNANLTAKSIDFTGYTGTFDFGSSTLSLNSGNATFVAGQGVTANAGTLEFTATLGTQTFTPKSGALFPTILKSGAGTVTVATNALNCQAMTVSGGTWNWGSSTLTHTPTSVNSVSGSTMTFGTNTVQTTGNAYLSGTVNANTGNLALSGTSDTQVLIPASGTSPNITHTGASTLQLSTNNLSCLSFSNSAGTLDLNGKNITTTTSGNFTVTNGTSSTFTNLGGRTLTVAGNASFTGTSSTNLLNLNPTSAWTLDATGTLTSSYADIAMSNASRSTGIPTNSVNGGGNTNWNFGATDFSAWFYSSKIVFNTTSTGANVSGNVDDFPLLVRLNANNFVFTQAKSDGSDIRFRDPDGTSLPYHIERWDATNKKAEVWVRVPRVDGNSTTDYVTLYWGNNAAAAVSSGTGVFGDYKAVFHLNESPGAVAPQFVDASGNANSGTAQGGAAGDSLTAVSDKGFNLNGSTKYVSTTTSFANPGTFTLGAWFKTKTGSGGHVIGFNSLQTGAGGSRDRFIWMDNNGKVNLCVNPGGVGYTVSSTSAYNDGTWHHVVGRLSSSGLYLYVDGASVASNATPTSAENYTGYWRAGYSSTGWSPIPTSDYFNGSLDEVTVTHSSLSADFIKLAYQTQKPGSSVISIPGTDLSTWSYSTKVYINTSATGANITSNQTNYPLLLRLTNANFNFAQANSNGSDLRFADSAGNLLSYEIERWDAAGKAADIWVLIPSVKGNNNGQWFKMHWGNGSAVSLSSGASVFLGSAGYVGVWHLSEDGGTTSGAYRDATGLENNGTGVALTSASDVSAVIGTGSNFTAASNQGITVANHASLNPTGALTLEAWVNTTTQAAYKRIAGKPFSSAASPWNQYDLELNDPGNKVIFSLTLAGTEAGYTTTSTLANGTWYNVAGTYDGSAQKVFLNGVMETSTARTGSISDYGQPLSIGKYYHDISSNLDGKVDEVRVSNVARSANWLKLGYETMKTGSTVVTVGSRSRDFAKSVQFNFNTTSTGANVAGNVTNVPILVRLSSTNFDFSVVRDDGADIRFIDKNGQHLYHEVVEWDKGNKTGKVWVKVPQVDGNSTADFIALYYGCSSCSGSPYAVKDSVWSGHAAVFHLAAVETRAFDAAKNAYHGDYQRSQPMAAGITTTLAPSFDGANDYIQTTVPTTAGTRTMSAWIYPRSSDNVAYIESVIDGDVAGQYGAGFGLDSGVFKAILDDQFWTTTRAVTLNAWQHVALKFNATNAVIYVNGASAATLAYTQGAITSTTLRVGRSAANALYFDGYINEVQVIDSYASDDYVKLSYENQKEGSLLFSTPITTASFSSSKAYKFNTTASGANVSGDVYNFPLLIRLTGAAIIGSCQANGPDIRFLDADGVTWLDYSIERWKATAPETADVWVKVPKIDGNSAGDFITLYYNDATNGSVPDGQCGTCVFDNNNGYNGVWHLNGTGSLGDATARGNAGTNGNTTTSAGIIGAGISSLTTQYIDFPNGTVSDLNDAVTISFWANGDAPTLPVNHQIFNAKDALNQRVLSAHLPYGSGTYYWDAGNSGGATYDRISKAADSINQYEGNWRYWTFTKNAQTGNMYIYYNGTQLQSGTGNTLRMYGMANTFRLGSLEAMNNYPGLVDELRVSRVERNADWVKLEYQTQRTDATPLFNPSAADFVSSRKYIFNTTRTGADVTADVENFPLLVRITDANGGMVDQVQDTYNDIRFLDGDGKTWLNYHVERWSKVLDSAEVWVMVPKVDGNSDHDFITLYYNDVTNGAVANGECSSCVFSTSNNFQAVWHLSNSLSDATANAITGTNTGSTDGDGVSGTGRNFDGVDDYISFGNPNALKNISSSITVEAWMRTSLSASTSVVSVIRHDGHYTAIQYNGASSVRTARWIPGGVNSTWSNFDANFVDNAWHHVVVQYNGLGNTKVWRDGSLLHNFNGSSGSLSTAGTANFMLGATETGTEDWTGRLDEVRVSDAFRDSNYIKLSYQTQRRSGNLFWNTRSGPNNNTTLTATPGSGAITLSWTTPVSDSSNADSVGIWLKYSGPPDSVRAAGQTKVVILPKTDSTYSYPATYPGNYYFALAVKNSAGNWSPFTATSIDTVNQGGSSSMTDTVYVDSAIGNDANSCNAARNPSMPKLTLENADDCETNGINDTLVIRVLPGTYGGASNETFDSNVKPVVIVSFDNNSRAVLNGSGTGSHDGAVRYWTAFLWGGVTLRNMDVKCAVNTYTGVYITGASGENGQAVEGCRIYNDGGLVHDKGIELNGTANNHHIAGNIIYQPATYGIANASDNSYNIVNNVFHGNGNANTKAIYVSTAAFAADATIANNIMHNWDYGIQTVSTTTSTGVISNNLFHLVTSGRELTGSTDANKIIKDPLFYSTTLADRHAFKLLPGSPAIDAGTSSYGSGAQACAIRYPQDLFGLTRPQGAVEDIGIYEGTGYTPNPTGDFDTLTNTVSGNTVIVKNSKWKLVWDMARGGGITGFYDMTGDTTANLVATSSLLFDARIDSYLASTQTGNTLAPVFWEKTKARAVVRQRLALSASLDLNIWYTVYPSGHVYIQSEIANLSSGALAVGTVEYMLKVGAATAVAKSAGSLSGISYKNGYGFLTTATKDAFLSVTQDLDGNGWFSEAWSQAGSITGTTDSLGFSTANLADPAQNMKRHHHFLLYVGDGSLDNGKASTLNADAYNPSPVTTSAGSLIHERSWQDHLGGHWTFDEGAGIVARDKSINYTNNSSTMTSCTWVSGKVGGALRFTTASAVTVPDHDALEVRRHFAVAFWVKPDFTAMESNAYVITKGISLSDGWYFRKNTGANTIRFRVDGATADSPVLTSGTWYHLMGTVGGSGQVHLYVNGVLVSASTTNAAMVANTSSLRFGENSGTNDKYAGDIDDVRIYHFGPGAGEIQAIVNRGFSFQSGHYHLRADNNNRLVALLNETMAQTRVQPAFRIDNWFGSKAPKYVYLNGTRLIPNVDFVADSIWNGSSTWDFGNSLMLQVNKVLTGTSQTLFVDDNDSTGYMGEAAKMKTLAVTATANDKITLQNFTGTTFGSASSGQWYLELDLNGWTNAANSRVTDTGFGEFNVWKAAAISPNLAVGSATQLVGKQDQAGQTLVTMKFNNTTNILFSSGLGYGGPANITYTLVDSSAARLSLTLSAMSITATGKNISLTKRWTVYPTGRIFGSFEITSTDFALDNPEVRLMTRFNSGVASAWAAATATANARWGVMGGDLDFHSVAGAVLSIKSAGATVTSPTSLLSGSVTSSDNTGGADQNARRMQLVTTLFEALDDPITVNFLADISKDFADSATADSLMRDLQTPAALTALTGTAATTDALDFNADGFAEGDGAYTYTAAASGTAHFKFVNTVTHFNPAFRIKSWTFATLPEFVVVDNQTLTKDYHYNAYVNTATSELILQFNKTYKPGTHLFYISHKTGLAVTLNHFEAISGEGVDTLRWSTESELENLGFNLYRRMAPVQDLPDSLFAGAERTPGAGIANALFENARTQAAAKAAQSAAGESDSAGADTLPELSLSPEELKAMGYVRVNPKLVPGAKGGSSATTQEYEYIDRTAAFGTAYDYLLEAVDFSGARVQYGPRTAKPKNPLETALYPNYPNPFNPITTLRFSLKERSKVSLMVYDAKGRLVRALIRPDKPMLPGKYRLIWDARDDKGFEVPSGQYFYRFTASKYQKTRKMILVK